MTVLQVIKEFLQICDEYSGLISPHSNQSIFCKDYMDNPFLIALFI